MFRFKAAESGRHACRAAVDRERSAQLAAGRTIPLGADWTLRVLGIRDGDADQPPVLIVEDMPGSASAPRADAP
jgi:hypothetical protein